LINKSLIIGLLSLALIVGSSNIGHVFAADPNGTPFLQEEIDAIIAIIQDLQDQLDNLHVTWANVSDKPLGFADDIDNDTLIEISSGCITNQIAKWDGTQWYCTDSADNSDGGEVALRKLDCLLIKDIFKQPPQINIHDGCSLRHIVFDTMDISGANLSYADLTDSSFDEANISYVDFSGANLSYVDFYGSDLSGVNFSGADLSGATFQNAFANPPCTGNEICDILPTS